jgi:hypothetical protein
MRQTSVLDAPANNVATIDVKESSLMRRQENNRNCLAVLLDSNFAGGGTENDRFRSK